MAQRRMISKAIHQDGKFLTLSPTSKILYDDLVLYADDDGFCSDTSLINLIDKATDENYQELEQAGFIINFDGVYLITDWLNLQVLTHYKRTNFLNLSSKVFIKIDFQYTINSQDKNIALPLDDWVENKNRSRKISLKSLQQQRLSAMVNKKVTNGKHDVNKKITKGIPSIDQYSNSLGKSSRDQIRQDQTSKDQDQDQVPTTQQRSSNGGMGKDSSSNISTSTKYNNATSENGELSGVSANNNSDNHDLPPIKENLNTPSENKEIAELMNIMNQNFNVSLPVDDERLRMLFDNLLNQYKPNYIQDAIDQLAIDSAGQQLTNSAVKSLMVNHLSESIKQALPR
ncbi:hypothetical protein HUK45_04000 [Limosilactobacillus sp. c9Ua_26_M]|uniref:Uncharacterized protein n=1 Tax=Limosilactobacillus urinaemulieris TaxID=2742600 RepID=A0ABR8ZJE5_9LACO|nr:hypothetical protein [Limosilactobacillus urinaemulieris]MBD8085417.1 hypothetical protein [Limosilactobacillus urinaemulieris]